MEIFKIQEVVRITNPASGIETTFANSLAIIGNDIYLLGNRVGQLSLSGTTAQRPSSPEVGFQYFDTTLGKYICYNGTAWVNMDGSALS